MASASIPTNESVRVLSVEVVQREQIPSKTRYENALKSIPWTYARPFISKELRDLIKMRQDFDKGKGLYSDEIAYDRLAERLEQERMALLTDARYKHLLTVYQNQSPNLVVEHTPPDYVEGSLKIREKRDVVVFLVGPTDHQVNVSQWRMEVIRQVAERIFPTLAKFPRSRVIFIVPEYLNQKSNGFKEEVPNELQPRWRHQLRWEHKWADLTDVVAAYFDLRLENPEDGSRGNFGPTVRWEGGEAVTKWSNGLADMMSYTPDGAMGVDWPQTRSEEIIELKYGISRFEIEETVKRIMGKPIQDLNLAERAQVQKEIERRYDEEIQKAAGCEGRTPADFLGYSKEVGPFIDGLAAKIVRAVESKNFSERCESKE